MTATEWAVMACVVLLALAVRIAFYTGFFGSDEVTYVHSALKAARGEPLTDVYIGAIRLGVNYPIAAFVQVFGVSEPVLAAYALLSSVAEVALVYLFGFAVGGPALALASSVLLALVPIHINLAGRLMADAPLGLFVTATFVSFYFGERSESRGWYLLAGACAGFVFWIKQATVIFLLPFMLWAVVRRRIEPKWFYAVGTFTAVVMLNFVETWRTSGNWGLLFDSTALARSHNTKFVQDTSPWTYFEYLLLDIRHTAALGWLAVSGSVVLAGSRFGRIEVDPLAHRYLLVWSAGLVVVFSFFIGGTDPLRLIPKQANYMTIFLAPLALLGGCAVAALSRTSVRALVLAAAAGLGVLLAGLQQESIRSFVANSRPAIEWAQHHPDRLHYVMTNAYRWQVWETLVRGRPAAPNVRSLAEFTPAEVDQWVVVDPATLGWGASDPDSLQSLPDCWIEQERIQPAIQASAGRAILAVMWEIANRMPTAIATRAADVLEPMRNPEPARVYRVPPGCGVVDKADS